jgi:hypothetical protein
MEKKKKKILWNFHGPPWNFMEFINSMDLRGLSMDLHGVYKFHGFSMDFHGGPFRFQRPLYN